jgi:type I restriction enzyme, R subunit
VKLTVEVIGGLPVGSTPERPEGTGIQRSAAGRTARYFFDDAPSTLIKLRQLAEFLAKQVAARHGLLPSNAISFDEVPRTLKLRSILPPEVANLFFHLKRVGNAAVHENVGTTADALPALKIARGAAIWFHQSYAIMPLSLTHPPFQTNTGPAAVLDENNSAGTSF